MLNYSFKAHFNEVIIKIFSSVHMQHLTKWNFYKRHSRLNYQKKILTNKGNNNTTLRSINNIDTLVIPNKILISFLIEPLKRALHNIPLRK